MLGIVAVIENGVTFNTADVWKVMIIPAIFMTFGLLFAIFITYRKPREYEDIQIEIDDTFDNVKLNKKQWGAIFGGLTAFAVQLLAVSSGISNTMGALPLGALCGLIVMLFFGSIEYKNIDESVYGGLKMMSFIAFVMLVASGFGAVIRETGGVETLVTKSSDILGNSKLIASTVMLIVGLIITMGIGTSFGTIPIIATIYVPIGVSVGFSPAAIALLIGVAGALGDAGSPASDSTLGPTSGLNFDGQHNHIKDTCIPTFLHYNIPLIFSGIIGSIIL